MATALTVYTLNAAASVSPMKKLGIVTGGTTTYWQATVDNQTGWVELRSASYTATAAGSIGNPTGNGWLLDDTSLEGQIFAATNWSGSFRKRANATGITATPYVRAYVYNITSQTYTAIGSWNAGSLSFTTSAVSSALTAAGASANPSFDTGDRLYIDVWINITANTAAVGTTVYSYYSNSATAGSTSNTYLVTPGYSSYARTTRTLSTVSAAVDVALVTVSHEVTPVSAAVSALGIERSVGSVSVALTALGISRPLADVRAAVAETHVVSITGVSASLLFTGQRDITTVSAALQALGVERSIVSVRSAVGAGGIERPVVSVSAALKALGVERPLVSVSVVVQQVGIQRPIVSVSTALSFTGTRPVVSVSTALQGTVSRDVTTVSTALTALGVQRSLTFVSGAIGQGGIERPVTGVSVALQALSIPRVLTTVSSAVQAAGVQRPITGVQAAIIRTGLSRSLSGIRVALLQTVTHPVSGVSSSVQATVSRSIVTVSTSVTLRLPRPVMTVSVAVQALGVQRPITGVVGAIGVEGLTRSVPLVSAAVQWSWWPRPHDHSVMTSANGTIQMEGTTGAITCMSPAGTLLFEERKT